MDIKLISHINGDADLLPSWFQYYSDMGVRSFHIVVHGSKEDNHRIYELCKTFPVSIVAQYEGEFNIEKKKEHLQHCLDLYRDNWILLADSDEFVELPYTSLKTVVEEMENTGPKKPAGNRYCR